MSLPSVAVLVTPGFSPFHFSVPCTIFGPVLADRPLFELTLCAEQPGTLKSLMGMSIETPHGLEALAQADLIIVPYWPHPGERPSAALCQSLNEAWQRGARVVGLCLGTYVLAYAGLLDGKRASTHWEFEQDFSARFPQVQLDTNALYVDEQRLITSAGTAAAMDCCLYLLRQFYGSAVANRVARRMVIPPHRDGGQAQYISHPIPQTTQDERINALLGYLRDSLDCQHDLDSLAARVMMSRRTFTRHFLRATGMSVGEWLNAERLHNSQQLLEMTEHSIEAVAALSGYQSVISFRQSFKQRYTVSPSEWRRTFQGGKSEP
ncbi:GlxA family transcriptional regulator [Erwinia sp. S38]|uniref:GlxA family transcriptional regulator n=1 Tax=Erwinia sp. S38 TaxID=2769338 RepID=UPI0019092916|nr:helix-turn-helix domain-containing protein [Erwinia sp. S38]MBK0002590.1 helix-turn-helix domain-containing protein [Erwinia sp. S38]